MEFARIMHVAGPALMGAATGAFIGMAHLSMTNPLDRDCAKHLGLTVTQQLSYRPDIVEALLSLHTAGALSYDHVRCIMTRLEQLFTLESYVSVADVQQTAESAKSDAIRIVGEVEGLLSDGMLENDVLFVENGFPASRDFRDAMVTVIQSCTGTLEGVFHAVDAHTKEHSAHLANAAK